MSSDNDTMKVFKKQRDIKGLSQRQLAVLSHHAFKTIQLIESGKHNVTLTTLEDVTQALGYPKGSVHDLLRLFFALPPESIFFTSLAIEAEGQSSFKTWLFNFVDQFRLDPQEIRVQMPPVSVSGKIKALMTSVVEMLCDEQNMSSPWWTESIHALESPWFVSESENLKASALIESPVHFRKRNIFVLSNFLERR